MSTITPREQQARAELSCLVLALIDKGYTLPAAWDLIFGAGAYRRLSDQVWDINNQQSTEAKS